ncbi:MAG: hypothetical protein R3A46_17320 [Thermomicrobiales bacterium]
MADAAVNLVADRRSAENGPQNVIQLRMSGVDVPVVAIGCTPADGASPGVDRGCLAERYDGKCRGFLIDRCSPELAGCGR